MLVILHVCACMCSFSCVFFFQAEDGIRDLVRSRGLGDVYKRQVETSIAYDRIPGFPLSTVESHSGRLLLGTLGTRLSLIHI